MTVHPQCDVPGLQEKEEPAAGKAKEQQLAEKSSGSGSGIAQSSDGKLKVKLPSRKSATPERSKLMPHDRLNPPKGLPLTLPKPSGSGSRS